MLVRATSPKPLLGISPNLVCICVLPDFQHLLIVSDLDLHLPSHFALILDWLICMGHLYHVVFYFANHVGVVDATLIGSA